MSGDRYFVDSNVFLYTFDTADPTKQAQAEAWIAWLWENACGSLSWQVLQEFYWNALGKFRADPDKTRYQVRLMSEWNPPDVPLGMIERAWHWIDQAQVSFWDGLIVAAAGRTGCRFVLSEDLQDGQKFGSVTILSPFKTSPPVS